MTQERNRLTTDHNAKDEYDITSEEAQKIFNSPEALQLIQKGHMLGKSVPMKILVTTPRGENNETMARRLMEGLEKSPWEFVPHGHPDLPQVHWGSPQIVSDDSELAKLSAKLQLDDIITDFAAQVVNNNSEILVKYVNDQLAKNIGISPELLNIPDPSPSMQMLMKNWSVHLGDVMRPSIDNAICKFAKDILLRQMKTFKAKTIHANGGSMRERRRRHTFTRIDKEVCIKETLFKDTYPTWVGMDTAHPDGDVSVIIHFDSLNKAQ
jgi:hypothetical protein